MLGQKLSQKLLQKLSPQQIQLMKLLQLNTIALEDRIKEELEANPALEEGVGADGSSEETGSDDPHESSETDDQRDFDIADYLQDETPNYKLYQGGGGSGGEEDEKTIPFAAGRSFQEVLEDQLGVLDLNEQEAVITRQLIGNLDEAGYLRRDLSAIVDDLAFTQGVTTNEEELSDCLEIIQGLDPAGIGARDLQECLLLQLNRKTENTVARKVAQEVIAHHFEAFTKKHYDKIIKKLEVDEEALREGIEEILKLNPKPGSAASEVQKQLEHISPDFILTVEDGELSVALNSRNAPELRVSRKYAEMLETYNESKGQNTKAQKEALLFVKQKLDGARWFIDAVRQRQHTLIVTMEAIASVQEAYFLSGDEKNMKPLILKDIADRVGLDISTISRVVKSKYVQTPYGTFLLKAFFSESISTDDGEEVSTREVKKILEDLISEEDKRKPLTDDRLAVILKEKGYNIARRTVAKYREQINIPVARLRKEI